MAAPSPEFLALQAALAGEYSLQRELGRGGMGIVYLARDVRLDREVAIKMLPLHLSGSSEFRERFLREARTAAGLSHPNIVPIHRVGEADGLVYFVMTYVEGETLGDRLRTRGPMSPADATRMMREVAWALAYAHGRGIVHRDIKPDNILLEAGTGRALVTDFGIAHGGASTGPVTDPGVVAGTAHFMSPEHALGEKVDGRSDIYALGVVGYVAVTGKLPFDAPNLPALLARQNTRSAPAVALSTAGLPRELSSAIDRSLNRDPAERFQDGEALAAALAPATDARPALPTTLRAWLGARNPLLLPYLVWSGGMSMLTSGNIYAVSIGNPGSSLWDVVMLAGSASVPLLPIIGFHIFQGARQFRAGHSLADLRTALEVAEREQFETDKMLAYGQRERLALNVMRGATLISASWFAVTVALLVAGVIHERNISFLWFVAPAAFTAVSVAFSNMMGVQFLPERVRKSLQNGIRNRLWKSRFGEWISRKLGAPERSRAVGAGVFRPTEAVLGLAAADLFAALPQTYRENLHELPATLAALEAHAAEARAELEIVAELAPTGTENAAVLDRRRNAATNHLAESVAALERIRMDLLRLHGGANDLTSLTTLMDAARIAGDDINRLADAEREVDRALSIGSGESGR